MSRAKILYRVYDREGNFVGVWKDVIKDIDISQRINRAAAVGYVELARNYDNKIRQSDLLVDDTGDPIVTSGT